MQRSVTAQIKGDPSACEAFFLVVVEAHVLTAAMKEFGMESFDDVPKNDEFNEEFLLKTQKERIDIFFNALSRIVEKYTYTLTMEKLADEGDGVLAYAKELLSLGMLYMEFVDGIREGDGLRILRCWRYFLLIFKAKQKRKYAIQAATILLQYHFTFTERMKQQLIWSRTINVAGKVGRNIPMDLHNEHLNRELKEAISHLSSNIGDLTIQRIGKSLHKLMKVKTNYDTCSGIAIDDSHHSSRSKTKDLQLIISELNKSNTFLSEKGRKHSQFTKFKGNTPSLVQISELKLWLTTQLRKMILT